MYFINFCHLGRALNNKKDKEDEWIEFSEILKII